MKTMTAALLAAVLVAPAHAGLLSCQFTEPFFSISYDSTTGKVVQLSADVFDEETGKPVPQVLATGASLKRADFWEGSPTLLLQAGNETILEIKMTQGSDGMSESVYPMEGRYGRNVGGCETDKVRAFDMWKLYQDLGLEP